MEPSSKNVRVDVVVSSPSPLPTLPFDLIGEILCRLPVKLLLQFQCVCKFWKSLISDPNFAKKHLCKSTSRHHLLVSNIDYKLNVFHFDSPIASVKQTEFSFPDSLKKQFGAPSGMCSCDGILCLVGSKGSFVLWNPYIRKFKILPTLNNTPNDTASLYGFGYDHLTNNYKVVAVFLNEVSVYTLGGTHSWRRIQDFPCSQIIGRSGVFVSGSVNWVTYDHTRGYPSPCDLVSLDLAKETYQKLSLPNSKKNMWDLGVLKDCLCFCASIWDMEVWVMKEFGNKESWTKLYAVSYCGLCFHVLAKPLHIYEDNKLLIKFYDMGNEKLGFYDSKNDTLNLKILKNQNMDHFKDPIIYAESLISPCF